MKKTKRKWTDYMAAEISRCEKTAALCPKTGICGGCAFGSVSYENEIEIKKAMLNNLFAPYLTEPLEIIPAAASTRYRNKTECSFGDSTKGGPLELGFRRPGAYYEVVDGGNCVLNPTDFNVIQKCVLDYFRKTGAAFYHKGSRTGELRHLVMRHGLNTGELMVNLVTAPGFGANLSPLAEKILALPTKSTVKSILHTVNSRVADVVAADEIRVIYGQDFFCEKILGLTFKISPFSFFQTNSAGAEALYSTVIDFAGKVDGNILDLYCGTGTITQLLSKNAKTVTGVELWEEAVHAARENALQNNADNCRFIAADAAKAVKELNLLPKLIVLDPPREGINPKAINPILAFGAEKIIYIACKPTSLQRDLPLFIEGGYNPVKMQAHDMFPRTYHTETVCLLSKRKTLEI